MCQSVAIVYLAIELPSLFREQHESECLPCLYLTLITVSSFLGHPNKVSGEHFNRHLEETIVPLALKNKGRFT